MRRQKIYGAYFLAILFVVATTGFQVIHHYCGSCEHTSILPAPVPHLSHEKEHHHDHDKPCCDAETHQQHSSCDVNIVRVEKPFVNNQDQDQEPDLSAITSEIFSQQPNASRQKTITGRHFATPSPSSLIYLYCQLLI